MKRRRITNRSSASIVRRPTRWAASLGLTAMLCSTALANAQDPSPTRQRPRGSAPYREALRRAQRGEEPKVVGGKRAPPGAYPWQVSLSIASRRDPVAGHFCGGSIFSERWIVTAAHCIESTDPTDVVVIAGTQTLDAHVVRRRVKRFVLRADFDLISRDNDVGLVELDEPMKINAAMTPIQILAPEREGEALIPGVKLTVVGWGATVENGVKVRDLRYAETPIVDRTACNRPLAYDGRVKLTMICAGSRTGRTTDACQGDSGGPLTATMPAGPRLVGVVSWGDGCAQPNRVGVYARMVLYNQWIADCVAKPEDCH